MTYQNDRREAEPPHRVVLARRSLQIQTGYVRFNYRHAIVNEDLKGERRVSITFRKETFAKEAKPKAKASAKAKARTAKAKREAAKEAARAKAKAKAGAASAAAKAAAALRAQPRRMGGSGA